MAEPNATKSWADDEEGGEIIIEENPEQIFADETYETTETEVDNNGVKTVTEYKKDHKTGERIKVTKKVKVIKRNERLKKAVVDRRQWQKFGNARDVRDKKLGEEFLQKFSGVGFQQEGVTYFPEPVMLDFTPKLKIDKKKSVVEEVAKPGSVVVCRVCGMTGDHWTLRCPNKEKIASGRMKPLEGANVSGASAADPIASKPTGAYVPPSLRGAGGERRTDLENIRTYRDDTATLRVSNLSDDTREEDLQQLFAPFGHITRVYLAKDRNTQRSRGFAFVNFVRKEDAAVAMEKLAGYGYDHLILQIEWAKPSE